MAPQEQAAQAVSPSLRPYAPALAFSFTNTLTWMILLGTPMVLLGEWIGASAFVVGLAYSALYLSLPAQVLGTATLHRFGYKKQMIFCWAARSLAIPTLFVLVLLRREGTQDWMCCLYVGSAWFFCILRAVGNSAVTPWMYAFIPPPVRGRYFATDQTTSSTCGILILMLVSSLFAFFSTSAAFAACLAIAMLGAVSSTATLFFWPDVSRPNHVSLRHMARRIPGLLTKPSPYRNYLFISVFWWFMISSITPFGAYYLKTEQHLSQALILVCTLFQYVGTLLGAVWISKRLDGRGVRPFFAAALGFFALTAVYWALLVLGVPVVVKFAALAFLFLGLGNAFFYSPNLKYLPQVCPKDDQPLALALNIAATGMAAGLSPIVWGILVRKSGGAPGIETGPFLVYLFCLLAAQAALLAPFLRLREQEGVRTLPMAFGRHLRFARYASRLLSLAHIQEHARQKK